MTLRIARYGKTRFWALYDGDVLVCVTVYKKGARAVQQRLAAQRLHQREVAQQAAAQETAIQHARVLAAQARTRAQQLTQTARG
jgi:hypothetical protein